MNTLARKSLGDLKRVTTPLRPCLAALRAIQLPLDTPNLPRSSATGKPGARYDSGIQFACKSNRDNRSSLSPLATLALNPANLSAYKPGICKSGVTVAGRKPHRQTLYDESTG
jgi:hypothetical protein